MRLCPAKLRFAGLSTRARGVSPSGGLPRKARTRGVAETVPWMHRAHALHLSDISRHVFDSRHLGNSRRLAAHLGLVTPPGAELNVGSARSLPWAAGRTVIWDDARQAGWQTGRLALHHIESQLACPPPPTPTHLPTHLSNYLYLRIHMSTMRVTPAKASFLLF